LKQVVFLGHIVSRGGISMDPSKVQDVLSWKAPTSVSNIQSFLGLGRYYQRFIEGFSKISTPMTELLKKDKMFKWTPAYEASFQELKKRLTTTPILVMLDLVKLFSIYCDASGQGLGCVLMQDGRVVAYASRQLRKHKVNYMTHNLELATVVHALKIWRHYLMGKRYELYTDHNSLKYIFTQSNLNLRQRRWLELIKDYDLGINYHPGKANIVADALSHRSHVSQLVVNSMPFELCEEFNKLNLRIIANTEAMDFIVGLSWTQSGYDSIWVIMDQLTKVAHFIPVKTTYSGPQLAELYMSRIVCLCGVPKKIVSDRGTQFTSRFWERLHETLDTQLRFSSAYHP
jgi:hypothetical protein